MTQPPALAAAPKHAQCLTRTLTDCPQNRISQVAMWIDKADSSAGPHIADNQSFKQRRLPHPRLSDDGDVPASIIRLDAKCLPL